MINSQRLKIRYYEYTDIDDIYEILSNEEALKFEPYEPLSYEEVKSEMFWRVFFKEYYAILLGEKVIGSIYYGHNDFSDIELGFIINPKYWRMGYAYEAVSAFLENHQDTVINARVFKENIASINLLYKLGFKMIEEGDILTFQLNRGVL